MAKQRIQTDRVAGILRGAFFVILAVVPFHAIISVWLTSNFGVEKVWQSWKEILLFLLTPLVISVLVASKQIRTTIFSRLINKLIISYGAVHLILWFWQDPKLDAAVAGILFNLRFLAMFVLAQILVCLLPQEHLREKAMKIVGIGGLIVVGFGLLQITLLPDNFLEHFGYGLNTIPPYQTIDKNENFIRISSTLRGANPLGLYLVLFATLVASWWRKRPSWLAGRPKWLLFPISLATAVTLYASHSRSAWLGAAVALAIFSWFTLGDKLKKPALLIAASLFMIAGLFAWINWQTDFVQNTLLHQDPGEGPSINSTEAHFRANQKGLEDLAENPLGQGPGSAGPASFYTSPSKISENYYIQIGQEVGVVGLGLFLATAYLAAASLFRQRKQIVPAVLLAGFVGISVANLFLHAWAQDEIALIWWGLAGLWYKD